MKIIFYILLLSLLIACSNGADPMAAGAPDITQVVTPLAPSAPKAEEGDFSISNDNIDFLKDELRSLQFKFEDLSNLNQELTNQNKKLVEENLLLQMSLKNLRRQYETSTIEKSIESKNILKERTQ